MSEVSNKLEAQAEARMAEFSATKAPGPPKSRATEQIRQSAKMFHNTAGEAIEPSQVSRSFSVPGVEMKRQNKGSLAGRYLTGLFSPLVVAGAMQLTWPFFAQSPGALFLPSIVFCAWYGGLGPGLLSTLVSLLLADYFFIKPYFSLWPPGNGDLVYLVTIAIVGTFVSVLSGLMHRARQRAEINLEELTQQAANSHKVAQVLDLANVLVCDLDDKITLWNTGMRYLYGWTKEDAVGVVSHHLLQTGFTIPLDEIKRELFRAGQWEGELTRTTKDGKQIVVASQWVLHYDEQGQPEAIVEVNTDITARKQAQERQQATEARYRTLFEYAPDGIVIADTNSYYLNANPSICRMLGYTRKELIGLHASDIVVQSEIEHIIPALTMIKAGVDYNRGWQFRRKDGSVFQAEVIATAMPDGNLLGMIRDITERKAQESLLQLAAIVESASEAIIGNTLDGTIITWNPGAASLFGYTVEEAIGRHLTIVVPADRVHEVPQLLEKISRRDSAAHYETVRLNKDGTQIDVSITVSPILDSAGKIIGASTIARDITEQKRAEEKLRESEEHYRNVAETATDAIITTDEESAITSVNRAAERIFGYRSEDLLGQKLTSLMPEYLRHVHQASLKTYITTGDRQLEYWECIELSGLKKGGMQIPVELSVSRFTKNSQHVFTCIVRDITERKHAQESLLRLAAIVKSSSDAIIGKTLDGIIFTWNPGAEKLFGYSAREAIGLHISIVIPADRVDEIPQLLERIGRSESAENYETVRLNREGREIDVALTVSPIKDSNGVVIGASTIARDITEQKHAEAQLKAMATDLLHSNRELEDFASIASHDLQEPLRKIQTFADELAEDCISTLSDENFDTLKRIQNAAGRMQRLINDLLSLSRITSRAQPFVPVNLNDLAHEVLSDLEVRIHETGSRVDIHEIPTIDAEPLQMRQLFQNLIGNALKFNSPGRAPIVSLRGELIGGEQGLADSSSEPRAQQLCQITFEDNGIGFDEKYVDRIFAMFQRLHGRNQYEGTGMGLAICRRIAEHHGGSITARSKLGTGSTFTVTIPVKRIKEKTL